MVVHVCCKGLLPMFQMCFLDACCKCVYLYVTYVSHIRCICFIWMFRMVAMIFKCFQIKCFRCMFQVFHLMLQLLYLGVSKADGVLHLSFSPSAASSRSVLSARAGHPYDAASASFRIRGAASYPSSLLDGAGPVWCA
jgi:hypothetical protein